MVKNNLVNRGRIAFLLSSLKFGGGERVVLNLAIALKNKGYSIDILLMSFEGEFLSEAQKQFNVIDLQCRRTWQLPHSVLIYLVRVQPIVLISSFWKLNLCACIARSLWPKTQLLVWEHSPPSRSKNSPTALYAVTSSLLYRFAKNVVTVSTGVAKDVRRITFGLDKKIIIIYNAIIPPKNIIVTRQSGGLRIVWVGRFDKPKNPGLMLEAFALLPRTREYVLDMVGDGPLRQTLQAQVNLLGINDSVNFHGFIANPYECMAQANLLVVSSDSEGLGNVLIEALFMGLRTVSTDCGQGIHDILQDNRYGTIVPTGNSVALAQAIQKELSENHNEDYQKRGAIRFEPRYIAQEFLKVLNL